ncbi:ATP-dependent Clp protease adaptor ClpS [uncultured Draconibacterium sp.]|jgi:ATP-dependent Clp protease adaptor protein ClpS|uniref:ATP-dependent Clp protease adaptor ClpS n=1 Tax=uncultured Draconibacterium sp. TaxID=1573823 RepID=UPI00321802ED
MTQKETKKNPVKNIQEDVNKENFLILHNDDVHTFDYVIDALVDICKHEYEQATQCTMLVHYKGKCDVKKGGFAALKPMKDALLERKLNATID